MKKNPHAVALGSLGGKKRAKALTKEERSAIARKASRAAQGKVTPEQRRRWGLAGAKARWKSNYAWRLEELCESKRGVWCGEAVGGCFVIGCASWKKGSSDQ